MTKTPQPTTATSSTPHSTNSRRHKNRPAKASRSAKTSRSHRSRTEVLHTIYFSIFVLVWAGLSLLASQFIVGLPIALLAGEKATTPFWTLIYYILSYALTLFLVLFVPPRLVQAFRRRQTAQSKSVSASTSSSASVSVNTPSTRAATAIVVAPIDLSTTPTELGLASFPTFVDLGLAPIGYLVYAVLSTLAVSLMSLFSWFDANQSQDVGFSYFLTTSDRLMAMLAVVFIAPICEEILMRGWLYGKLRTQLHPALAIFLTSLLFGLLHGQWNVGVTVFVLSVVLCTLREITGTIWSGILLHILTNGIAFYILYIAGGL